MNIKHKTVCKLRTVAIQAFVARGGHHASGSDNQHFYVTSARKIILLMFTMGRLVAAITCGTAVPVSKVVRALPYSYTLDYHFSGPAPRSISVPNFKYLVSPAPEMQKGPKCYKNFHFCG